MGIATVVEEAILDGLRLLVAKGELDASAISGARNWVIERPKKAEHGDFATNVAMTLSKIAKAPPRAVADKLVAALAGSPVIRSAEVAGPGFINLRLHPSAIHEELSKILAAKGGYGRAPSASKERIHLEFVSANPVGPINVASGRNAILGDSIGRVLEAAGNRVTREYYINDFGNQVTLFADSVVALSEGKDVPEEGYKGEYVKALAMHLKATNPGIFSRPKDEFARFCVSLMLRGVTGSSALIGIQQTLVELGIHHDVWFSEESLHRSGAVALALDTLEAGGFLQRKDGALFFVAKKNEDEKNQDKDRVVQKSDGSYTYFASDIAYHADKIRRGYDRLIVILGVDHHGYVARVQNSIEALGLPKDRYEAVLYQFVYIYKNGELVKSSKRAGNFVTVEEVAEEIDAKAGRKGAGTDALRFSFLSRGSTSQIDFDIELATKKSMDNPVFYVQYGHARLSSILKKAEELGVDVPRSLRAEGFAKLVHPLELDLALRLGEFPEMIESAAASREPHKVAFYIQELAREFQSYFTRMKGDPILPQESVRAVEGWEKSWDFEKTRARLAWIVAIRDVYRTALSILGVSAPDRMDLPEGGEEVAVAVV